MSKESEQNDSYILTEKMKKNLVEDVKKRKYKIVGEGVYGKVYKVPSKNIVIKQIKYENRFIDKKNTLFQQASNYSLLNKLPLKHFMVNYYGDYKDGKDIYIFLEFLNPKDGWVSIDKVKSLSKKAIMKEVLIVADKFHKLGFFHRDLYSNENIVFNDLTGNIKFIDFGLSISEIDFEVYNITLENLNFLIHKPFLVCRDFLALLLVMIKTKKVNASCIKRRLIKIFKKNDILQIKMNFFVDTIEGKQYETFSGLFPIFCKPSIPEHEIKKVYDTQTNIFKILKKRNDTLYRNFKDFFGSVNPYL